MSEDVISRQETTPEQRPVVDILCGRYEAHFTDIKNLPMILNRGLYSRIFAKRVKDENYPKGNAPSVGVSTFFLEEGGTIWKGFHDANSKSLGKRVGFVLKLPPRDNIGLPRETKFRIPPRKFIGLVLVDNTVRSSDVYYAHLQWKYLIKGTEMNELVQQIEAIKKIYDLTHPKTGPLPIYGTSGNLYYPYRKSHAEIIEEMGK